MSKRSKSLNYIEKKTGLIFCKKCEQLKPKEQMVSDKSMKRGFKRLCKECNRSKTEPLFTCRVCGRTLPKSKFRKASEYYWKDTINVCLDCDIPKKYTIKSDDVFMKWISDDNYDLEKADKLGLFDSKYYPIQDVKAKHFLVNENFNKKWRVILLEENSFELDNIKIQMRKKGCKTWTTVF